MTHSRRVWGTLALLLVGVLVGGTPAKPAAKPPALDIGFSGTVGQFLQPDPKLPGKFLWKIFVQGAFAMPQSNGYSGRLAGVTAYLYQHGVASARVTAPVATFNSVQQVIVATGPGRVKAQSLIEQGTTLEADKMTWYAKQNHLIAVGNVVYHNGKTGGVMRIPRAPVVADTVLKAVSFGAGTGSLP